MRVSRGYRRNERSPTKGMDTLHFVTSFRPFLIVEMREARLRALTQYYLLRCNYALSVEMREARLRALTQSKDQRKLIVFLRRNERSPTKGIDTRVHILYVSKPKACRNERSPTKGIDTLRRTLLHNSLIKS